MLKPAKDRRWQKTQKNESHGWLEEVRGLSEWRASSAFHIHILTPRQLWSANPTWDVPEVMSQPDPRHITGKETPTVTFMAICCLLKGPAGDEGGRTDSRGARNHP